MEKWEIRYKHEKDKRDVMCIMNNIKIPDNEKYGEVRTPKGLYNTFNGKIFNKEFSKKGHNKMEFKICMCNK